ncbi:MAG TPA: Asp23/Gls24 family envelope stress response protein [Bacillota bacterium]|nr:Asp23/Gls24 family envelope stress response protein [Bacillota bacterium]
MKIYGLAGASGTGKSFNAQNLTSEMDIICIIDDGLLIMGTKVLAGTSAKREATKIASIRRALFMDPDHAVEVKDAIGAYKPKSILIIGTSVSMIEKIARRLELPKIEKIVKIEDVASEREIKLAKKQRKEEGKHVIPVPTFAISKDFSGFFLDTLRIFMARGGSRPVTLEKTVVRPTFSYLGKFYIADSAIEAIVVHCVKKTEGVSKTMKTTISSEDGGIIIDIDLAVYYGYKIDGMLEGIQNSVKEDTGHMTGLNVLQVNVTAKRLTLKEKSKDR